MLAEQHQGEDPRDAQAQPDRAGGRGDGPAGEHAQCRLPRQSEVGEARLRRHPAADQPRHELGGVVDQEARLDQPLRVDRAEPLPSGRHGTRPQAGPGAAARCSSISAWPSGSRTASPGKPQFRLRQGHDARRDEGVVAGASAASAWSALPVARLTCQNHRSPALVSGGIGRPSRGVRYSSNSMPGPAARAAP